jgi:hypothetical protein
MSKYVYLMWSLIDRYEKVVKEICKMYVFGEKGSP